MVIVLWRHWENAEVEHSALRALLMAADERDVVLALGATACRAVVKGAVQAVKPASLFKVLRKLLQLAEIPDVGMN